MPKNITKTAAALDENNPRFEIKVNFFLRGEDDNGDPLSGTDQVYASVSIPVDKSGDETGTEVIRVQRQVNSIPDGVISAQEKADLLAVLKKMVNAAAASEGY